MKTLEQIQRKLDQKINILTITALLCYLISFLLFIFNI